MALASENGYNRVSTRISMNLWVKVGIKIHDHLKYDSQGVPIAWGCFLFIAIGFIDYQIDPDISLSIFYLLPIALLTWFITKRAILWAWGLSAIAEFFTAQPMKLLEASSVAVYWNVGDRLLFYLIVSCLLYKLRITLEREKDLARVDEKTGVANKRLFLELAKLEVKKANRYRHPLTVVYLDIDDFRHFNEIVGYSIGDRMLQAAAETLKTTLRETDLIARIGGDEFIILLAGNGYESAQTVIHRVQRELGEAMQKNQWAVTFSIGAVTFINPPNSAEDMIHKADRLMYLVKASGKNQLTHKTSYEGNFRIPANRSD